MCDSSAIRAYAFHMALGEVQHTGAHGRYADEGAGTDCPELSVQTGGVRHAAWRHDAAQSSHVDGGQNGRSHHRSAVLSNPSSFGENSCNYLAITG